MNRILLYFFYISVFILWLPLHATAQTSHDQCSSGNEIFIPNDGLAIGVFYSDTINLNACTVEPGESFPFAIRNQGLTNRSAWFKLELKNPRSVRIALRNHSNTLYPGDVGFSVYKANNCIPNQSQLSNELTPLATFGNTFHPCVPAGTYYIQISDNGLRDGNVFLSVTLDYSQAIMDSYRQPHKFDTLRTTVATSSFNPKCFSYDTTAEICNTNLFPSTHKYTKTSWHTFTIGNYSEAILFALAKQSNTAFSEKNIVGFSVYEGDVWAVGINGLTSVIECDTFALNQTIASIKSFECGNLFRTNTTYSIRLNFEQTFDDNVGLALLNIGSGNSNGHTPDSTALANTNKLGTISSGNYRVRDFFTCLSRHSLDTNTCITKRDTTNGYDLSEYFTFSLNRYSRVALNMDSIGCGDLKVKIYSTGLSANCNDLTNANLYAEFSTTSFVMPCLPPGNYTVQVLAKSRRTVNSFYYTSLGLINNCYFSNLGRSFQIGVNVMSAPAQNLSQFNLSSANNVFQYNNNNPLLHGNTYTSKADTLACPNTVLPGNRPCTTAYTKAIYRQFSLTDSSFVSLEQLNSQAISNNLSTGINFAGNILYEGNALALATAQNAWTYPNTINGLNPISTCIVSNVNTPKEFCLTPGTYTFVMLGDTGLTGFIDSTRIKVQRDMRSRFGNPAAPYNAGNILDSFAIRNITSFTTPMDTFTCIDNAVTIDNYAPCGTKASYIEFYLSTPTNELKIESAVQNYSFAIFSGRSSQGLNTLRLVDSCNTIAQRLKCNRFEAGWYTVVIYGRGNSYYSNQFTLLNRTTNAIKFSIGPNAPLAPKNFNRPSLASIDPVTRLPHNIAWDITQASANYPVTKKTYRLPEAIFDCEADTPFVGYSINSCGNYNRVAYYILNVPYESYVNIYNQFATSLYTGDIRLDSASFATKSPIAACRIDRNGIEICKLQPGVYTLAVFASNADIGKSAITDIMVDRIGYSRFDHISNAYDFGVVPANSTTLKGKIGDIHPTNPNLNPSNDFIYCTTGADWTDTLQMVNYSRTRINANCFDKINRRMYQSPDTNMSMQTAATSSEISRNLWYTYQVVGEGRRSTIQVNNLTLGHDSSYRIYLFRSRDNSNLSFEQLKNTNQFDSLNLVRLSHIGETCDTTRQILTYADTQRTCNQTTDTTRYFILIESKTSNTILTRPNFQLDVSITVDDLFQPSNLRFDHYSTADSIGLVDQYQTLYSGQDGEMICATKGLVYPGNSRNSICNKTLWYHFDLNMNAQSNFYVRFVGDNIPEPASNQSSSSRFKLFREITPGDTVNGLVEIPLSRFNMNNEKWHSTCLDTSMNGRFYLVMQECSGHIVNFEGRPEFYLDTLSGNYCATAAYTSISGNQNLRDTLYTRCHDIGGDFGEFNTVMDCPPYGNINDYKSSWFKLEITGNDTVDLTTKLTTSGGPAYYRKMVGDCNSMVSESCITDINTVNTYNCLHPNTTHYFQVFTPANRDVNIFIEYETWKSRDTCKANPTCITAANFSYNFDCSISDSIYFSNNSTFGNAVSYIWNFGYNNDTSHAVSPAYKYPSSNINSTYQVTLTVINEACNDTAQYRSNIIVPAIINLNLGNDTFLCGTNAVTLNPGNYFGAVYLWDDNSTNYNRTVSDTGTKTYWVSATFNGCTDTDTITVSYSPLNKTMKDTTYLCTTNDTAILASIHQAASIQYLWSNNANTSSISVNNPGWYWVDVTVDSCTVRDSFLVQLADTSIKLLPPDSHLCTWGQGIWLDASYPGATNYLWSNNATNAAITATNFGTYWVSALLGTCTISDTVHLIQAPRYDIVVYDTICSGQVYTLPSSRVINIAGTYTDTLLTQWNCDSIITTHLMINPKDTIHETIGICFQQLPYTWNGNTYNQTGTYQTVLTNRFGCDSLVYLHLTIDNKIYTNLYDSICDNQIPYVYNNRNITTPGNYVDTFRNIVGCDSIVTLALTFRATHNLYLEDAICDGSSGYLFGDTMLYASGQYVRRFQNQSGCDSVVTLRLNINTPPSGPTVISPVTYCLNAPALPLTANGTGLLWYLTATGGTGNPIAPTPSTSQVGNTTYYVSQTISGCESARFPIVVSIIHRPSVDFSIDSLLCTENIGIATLTSNFSSAYNYVWDWDGANTTVIGNQRYEVAWNTPGTKAVKLVVQGTFCNSDTLTKYVTVSPNQIVLDTLFPSSMCLNSLVRLGSNNSADPDLSYQWWINGVPHSNTSPYLDFSTNNLGNVRIKVTVTHKNCGSKTFEGSIYVSGYPKADIVPNLPQVCVGDTLEFWNSEVINGYNYAWSPKDIIVQENIPLGHAQVIANQEDPLIITVTNQYGCSQSDTLKIDAAHCCDVWFPNAFSPNQDGLNDEFKIILTGKQELVELRIFNRNGQEVFYTQNPNEGWDGSYNGKQGDLGVYYFYFKYKCTDGKTHMRKSDLTLIR